MKTIKFLTYAVFVLFLGVAITSCKGDDGADGADGIDGSAGADGLDGNDGNDGNANVQTLTYDISTESGIEFSVSVPEITQSVIDNDVVLSYVLSAANWSYPIPGPGIAGAHLIRNYFNSTFYSLGFKNWDGTNLDMTAGQYTTLKLIIIESTGSKSAGNNTAQVEIYTELKNAGVDINDYQDVCDYYGIKQ